MNLQFSCFRHFQAVDLNTHIYFLFGNPIAQSLSHKDLSVTMERKLKFNGNTSGAAAKVGGIITIFLKARVNLSTNFMRFLLVSDIRPVLEFASPIWNLGFIERIKIMEEFQHRWTKQVSGLTALSYLERLSALEL